MSDVAIRVNGLGKRYRIGKRQESYKALRDVVADTCKAPARWVNKVLRGQKSDPTNADDLVWVLRDLCFEIKHGEVVGLIGRNGAGKSTLLKILSRITRPTAGWADIHGRVGSLLEVGTGFHPELTGSENIYLNGAILGMRRAEIDGKFDEIVSFAEIDRFLDTPVKRYSSGMRMRLAFAVAAHLETEIILVDEVLAVGDARFQKKCLSKMEDVGKKGRTVVFVSHNMPAVTRLCPRTILLDEGKVLEDGDSSKVVGAYLNSGLGTTARREWPQSAAAPGGDVTRLQSVCVRNGDGRVVESLDIRQPVAIEMDYEVNERGHKLLPHFHFYNEEGVQMFSAHDLDPEWRGRARPPGRYVSTAWIPGNLLSEGLVFVTPAMIALEPFSVQFVENSVITFQVIDSVDGDSARGDWTGKMKGVVRPMLKWTTQFSSKGK